MADFFTGDSKTARAMFKGSDGMEKPVQGDIAWSVTPADAVVFGGSPGSSLTNQIVMGLPVNGFVISATADRNMNPDIVDALTVASAPHNILSEEAQGGEVVIE